LQTRDARCGAGKRLVAALAAAKEPDVVVHPYPLTPYHPDYLGHVDLIPDRTAAAEGESGELSLKAPAGPKLEGRFRVDPTDWDVAVDEIPIAAVLQTTGGATAWPAPPWARDGWFQAYHLQRATVGDPADRTRADELYGRLTHDEFKDAAERLNLERDLIAALTRGCERLVVGYRLRREAYNDDFSGGIENILTDAQSGFNSPVFIRTVKLKDFPWNGWLRLGLAERPAAAWNPVAGFTDAAGRLVWATVGDDAFVPVPHNDRWLPNRVEVPPDEAPPVRQSQRIPEDAVMPQAGTGVIAPVGPGKGATAHVSYRVLASAFHDGSEMEAADLLYPYAFAFRWGAGKAEAAERAAFDPEVAAATTLMRERLRGIRVVRVEEKSLQIADLTFNYRIPIVEVYLDNITADPEETALLAPPWSSVPWHVLALMEAAVERGMAAFSKAEAERRRLPWLDLVRDPAQMAKMRALIKEFAASGYQPAALAGLVSPEAAKARWEALDKFAQETGHLMVTNGPYRLASASPDAIVLNVVREFTYPVGIGTFDFHAYPPKAFVTRVEHIGNRVFVSADVDVAVKQQRDHRVVRVPLRRDTLRVTYPIRPLTRYVVIGEDRKVAAAGDGKWEPDGRFAISLPSLPAGAYTLFTAVLADGNAIDPDIGHLSFSQ
jgi:hypothetical protein